MMRTKAMTEEGMQLQADEAFATPLAVQKGNATIETNLPTVATAQAVAVKRNVPAILAQLRELAAMAGDSWTYRYSVRGQGGGAEWIEGPSIKAANSVARVYGNCEIDTRIVESADSWMIYARFVDWETGFSYTRPFQQRKNQATIGRDRGRQQDMALQIGVSKAIRNVVTNSLEVFTTFAFEEAKRNVIDKVGKNLAEYKERILDRLSTMEIDVARVERIVGRSPDNWLAGDVARIIAQIQAIGDGMATVDETWPEVRAGGEAPLTGSKLERLEAAIKEQKTPPKKPAPVAPTAEPVLPLAETVPQREPLDIILINRLPGTQHLDWRGYHQAMTDALSELDPARLDEFLDRNADGLGQIKIQQTHLWRQISEFATSIRDAESEK